MAAAAPVAAPLAPAPAPGATARGTRQRRGAAGAAAEAPANPPPTTTAAALLDATVKTAAAEVTAEEATLVTLEAAVTTAVTAKEALPKSGVGAKAALSAAGKVVTDARAAVKTGNQRVIAAKLALDQAKAGGPRTPSAADLARVAAELEASAAASAAAATAAADAAAGGRAAKRAKLDKAAAAAAAAAAAHAALLAEESDASSNEPQLQPGAGGGGGMAASPARGAGRPRYDEARAVAASKGLNLGREGAHVYSARETQTLRGLMEQQQCNTQGLFMVGGDPYGATFSNLLALGYENLQGGQGPALGVTLSAPSVGAGSRAGAVPVFSMGPASALALDVTVALRAVARFFASVPLGTLDPFRSSPQAAGREKQFKAAVAGVFANLIRGVEAAEISEVPSIANAIGVAVAQRLLTSGTAVLCAPGRGLDERTLVAYAHLGQEALHQGTASAQHATAAAGGGGAGGGWGPPGPAQPSWAAPPRLQRTHAQQQPPPPSQQQPPPPPQQQLQYQQQQPPTPWQAQSGAGAAPAGAARVAKPILRAAWFCARFPGAVMVAAICPFHGPPHGATRAGGEPNHSYLKCSLWEGLSREDQAHVPPLGCMWSQHPAHATG